MWWQWHQLDHMQIICTTLQTDNHASTPSLSFFTGRMLFLTPNQQCQSKPVETFRRCLSICNQKTSTVVSTCRPIWQCSWWWCNLDLLPLDLRDKHAVHCISTKFGVDRSIPFPFRAWTQQQNFKFPWEIYQWARFENGSTSVKVMMKKLEIISTLLRRIEIPPPTVAPWWEALYKDRQSNRRVGVF